MTIEVPTLEIKSRSLLKILELEGENYNLTRDDIIYRSIRFGPQSLHNNNNLLTKLSDQQS